MQPNLKNLFLVFVNLVLLGYVLLLAGITSSSPYFWAMYMVLFSFYFAIAALERDRYLRGQDEKCRQCRATLPSSAPSAPASTNQHDATPPQP